MSAAKIQPPAVIDPNQRYEMVEACAILRQSKAGVYKDIAAGRLSVIKEGARTYVHGTELIRRSRVGLSAPRDKVTA